MSFEINIGGDADETSTPKIKAGNKAEFLQDWPLNKIAETFARFKQQNRTLIVPIGFPQAGKSLLLSSLMHYASKNTGETALFKPQLEQAAPFDKGRIVFDKMVDDFAREKIYDTTARGTLDLIGINMEPLKSKLPLLKLAFLDLAGEDIKSIKTSAGAMFTDKINAVLQGIAVDNSPVVFTLITPFQPVTLDGESIEDAHHREDTLLSDFLNYIKMMQLQIFKNATFVIVISQWDKNPNENESTEAFIKENRPSVYALVRNTKVFWGAYSIGKILVSTGERGEKTQQIISRNKEYPSKFWNMLYQVCTGKTLNPKTWWQKLLD